MFKYFRNRKRKGQSTLEYAILIIIIIGALLAIQNYIKRGVQGRLKSATDDIGDQFSPGNTNVIRTMTREGKTLQTNTQKRGRNNELIVDEVTTELMNSRVLDDTFEFFGN